MKKLFVFVFILLMAVAGWFTYDAWEKNRDISAWSIIPEDAFLVYEATNIIEVLSELDSIKTYRALSTIPQVNKIQTSLRQLDSITAASGAKKGKIQLLLKDNPVLVSLHISGAHKFDFLYAIELKTIEHHTTIARLVENYADKHRKITRKYLGKTISEIRTGDEVFSYIFYKNYFICSFMPILVEDAIRTVTDSQYPGFSQNHQELFKLAKLTQDHGNLYFNLKQLGRMAEVFTDRLKIDVSDLYNFSHQAFLDVRFEENNLLLNGFSLNDPSAQSILATFRENPGVPFTFQNLIPNNTAYIYHFSFQDPGRWRNRWQQLWKNDFDEIAKKKASLKRGYDIDLDVFEQWIGRELAYVALESSQVTEDYLVVVSTPDIGEAYNQLNVTTERMAQADSDTVYRETYANREIREIKIPELPYLLFGPPFSGFETTFFLPIDGLIVFSNSIEALKSVLDNIENENTWGKSVKMINFLGSINKESNLSIIANTSRSWNRWSNKLDATWQADFEKNAAVLKTFENTAIQFSNIDNKFYTNIVVSQPEKFESKQFLKTIRPEKNIVLPSKITSRPYFGRNHEDKSIELTLQDEEGTFFHISSDFEVLWSDSIPRSIQTDVYQWDFFQNNKLQFLFATQDKIYSKTRLGDDLTVFPLAIPGKEPLQFLSLIDYDRSKNYRLGLADTKGNVWLTDRSGKPLEGWSPKSFGSPLVMAPFHLRIAARDVIFAGLKNGTMHMLNRRGEYYKGFPLDLKDPLENRIFVKKGSNFANTLFTTVTKNGEIIRFSGTGVINKREQLIKTNAATRFEMVEDVLNTGFILSRIDDYRVGILNSQGKLLFEKDYISTEALLFQYYNFGAGNEIIAITDQQQGYTYLFNRDGTLINFQPINSEFQVGIIYSEVNNEYKVYAVYENELSQLSIKK